MERWHQTLQTDFLNDAGPFASVAEAQAAVDAWRQEYNTERPHQLLDMATPASRFRPSPQAADALSLWMPADLEPVTGLPPAPGDEPAMVEPASWPDAVEVDRVVPPSGNMWVGGQQFWLSPARAGQKVTLRMDTSTCHLSIGGWRIKTVPSRLTEVDLARLRRADARPARRPPGHLRARPAPPAGKSTVTRPAPPTAEGGKPLPEISSTRPTRPNSPTCCSSSPAGWPATPARLAASLEEFVGHPAYGTAQLRAHLERFVFPLGGSDGEPLFGP